MKKTINFWTKEEDAKLLKAINEGLKNNPRVDVFKKFVDNNLPNRTYAAVSFRIANLSKHGKKPSKVAAISAKQPVMFDGLEIQSYTAKKANITYMNAVIKVGNNILTSKEISITHV